MIIQGISFSVRHHVCHYHFYRIPQFRCTFCSYLSELGSLTKEHIASEHPDWKNELLKKGRSKSSHSNPNWLHELQSEYKKIIIEDCSRRARDAVDRNEKISDCTEWNEIFNHIVNTTVKHLEDVHGGVRVPSRIIKINFHMC